MDTTKRFKSPRVSILVLLAALAVAAVAAKFAAGSGPLDAPLPVAGVVVGFFGALLMQVFLRDLFFRPFGK